nr:MAG TPA: hypothetical protein [Caudoviricetes sp.]
MEYPAGSRAAGTQRLFRKGNERSLPMPMPQVGTSHPHGHDLQQAAKDKLAAYPLRFAARSSGGAG